MTRKIQSEDEWRPVCMDIQEELLQRQLLNLKVKHKAFGEGIVKEVSGRYLTIEFAAKESKFIFPDVFENYIVAEDPTIQSAIMADISKARQAAEEQRQAVEAAQKVEEGCRVAKKQVAPTKKIKRNIEDGFGLDYNVQHLAKQPILTYQQVEDQFGIKIAGFGRGINRTSSTVVLISSVDKKKMGFVYHDYWTTDGDYIYSGEGKTGDQQMTLGNKAIVDAERDRKQIHLFVKFSPREYYYQGVFKLVDYTYDDDKDEAGIVRKEYKFRLKKHPTED